MAGSAVNMARLIALGQGFSDLVEPEVRVRRTRKRKTAVAA